MPTAFFVLALTVLGFVLGGFFGGRVFARGSGLDGMIQALGGVMIGTGVAFVLGIAVVRWLSRTARVAGGSLALAAAVALLIGMQLVPPTPRPVTSAAPSEAAEPPFDPPFAVTLLEGDGSTSSSAPGSGLAWKTLTVRSLDSGWTVVRWQDPSKACHASIGRDSLERIAQALQAIPGEAACAPCTTCDRQSLVWSVGNGGGDRPIDSRCLASRAEFAALIDAFREVERRVSANEQCAPIERAGP